MEELLHELGLDPKAVVIQALGFLCVFLVLKKYLFGRVGRMLDGRREEIAARIRETENLEARAEQLTEELEQRLRDADEEARSRIRQSEEEARQRREEILAKAQSEAAEEIERGRREIEWERQHILMNIREIVADLTVTATEKILGTTLDTEGQHRIMDRLIDRIPLPGGGNEPQ